MVPTSLCGYFDRFRILHKLGVALWARPQFHTSPDDLEKSTALTRKLYASFRMDTTRERNCILGHGAPKTPRDAQRPHGR